MRTRTTVAVAAIGLCTCELAYSAPPATPSSAESPAPVTGAYLGLDGGGLWVSESVLGATLNISGPSFGAFAGYQFNPYVAVEGDYQYLSASGSLFGVAVRGHGYAFEGCLLPTLPVSPHAGFFARLGESITTTR